MLREDQRNRIRNPEPGTGTNIWLKRKLFFQYFQCRFIKKHLRYERTKVQQLCTHIHLNLYEKLEEFKYFRKSNFQEIFHNCSCNLADFRKTIDLYYKILYSANLENHFRGGLTENFLQYLLRTYCIHGPIRHAVFLKA